MNTIGQRIKSARKKANLTQAQLATKCGLAPISVQQYERDKRQPRLEQLQQIADALGCSLLFLTSGEGEMTAEASAERIRELETELKEARDTIAELKAKLYDCMTAAETIRDLKARLYDLTAAETQE